MGATRSTIIALTYPGWTFNNNSTKDDPPYCPCHTRTASYTVTRRSHHPSALVVWFLLSSSLCYLAALYGTISGCCRGDTHYPSCPLFLLLPAIVSLFLAMYSPVIHKSHSSSGLRTALVLIAFKILSRPSGVGTCIRRQLNAPILICRLACLPYRLYKRTAGPVYSITFVHVNEETASFIRPYERPSIDQRSTREDQSYGGFATLHYMTYLFGPDLIPTLTSLP